MISIGKRVPRTGFQQLQTVNWAFSDTGFSVQIEEHWVMLTPLDLGAQGLACLSSLLHSMYPRPQQQQIFW